MLKLRMQQLERGDKPNPITLSVEAPKLNSKIIGSLKNQLFINPFW
jgi:hypothetical protein